MSATRPRLRLGTRGSELARRQARLVAALLRSADPGLDVEECVIETRGDRDRTTPIPELGERGIFTGALEGALLAGSIDAAVHSLKDLPIGSSPAVALPAVCCRDDPRDVLVSRGGAVLASLPPGAIVGTSSTRRAAQLLAARADLSVRPLRGNVETRLAEVTSGACDAIVLAAAGLLRLGLGDRITEYLPPEDFLPAPGQGALAVQCRARDTALASFIAAIDDPAARSATAAERAFLDALGGGCVVPVAALAERRGDTLVLRGFVGAPDGSRSIRAEERGSALAPEALGAALAVRFAERGARALMA